MITKEERKELLEALGRLFSEYRELDQFLLANWPRLQHRDFLSPYEEFGAAKARLVERLENVGWINEFRDAIDKKLSAFGAGLDGAPIPEEINRETQWKEWLAVYRKARDTRPGFVQLSLLPCVNRDAPEAFVTRIRKWIEVRNAGQTREAVHRTRAVITWDDCSDQQAIRESYQEKLFNEFRVDDLQQLAGRLHAYRYVLVEKRLSVEDFAAEDLHEFVRWLTQEFWPDLAGEKTQILLFIYVEHPEPPPDTRQTELREKLALQTGESVCVLPVLPEILRRHIKTWAGQFHGLDVDTVVEEIAGAHQTMRKREVLKRIEAWQQKRQQERLSR